MSLQRRIDLAVAALDESWGVWPAMPKRVVEATSRALGGWSIVVHHWSERELSFDAHNLPCDPAKSRWVREGLGRRMRVYDPARLGSDADRVVTGDELRHRHPEAWEAFEVWGLPHLGVGDQTRAVLTGDDGAFMAFFGAYTPPGRRADPEGVETFARLLRPVTERLRTWTLLARTSPDRAAILELTSELSKPAFVISDTGAVLFANLAARLAYKRPPPWLPDACLSPSPPAWLRRIPLTEGSRQLWVCLPREADIDVERLGTRAAQQWGLPARLHSTAAKLIAGYGDKEIARQTGLAFTTVRTYVQLVFRHVGVSSRAALMREAFRSLGN
jgi:hypothetical protein